ncbi:MAG: ABC transporter substrate-binding protein [Candidatus Metalachnospira sp.]|nr:ABC transporter substrate-binding protein [Candidatus Metalachnospira sp.]
MKITTNLHKIISLGLVAACAVSSVTGCSSSASISKKEESDTYKIAVIAPLTGDAAQYGITYQNSLDILVDKVNSNNGINGKKVELTYFDDKKDAKEALNIANKIVSEGDYIAVVGSQTSSCSMAAAPVLQEEGIPMISPQASNPQFTELGDYIFSMQLSSSYEAKLTAKMIAENYGYKNIAVIYSNDDWGVGVNTQFIESMEGYGGTVTADETYISGQTKDFSPLISKMKESKPEAVFVASLYSDAAQILQQSKNLDFDVPVFATNTLYKQEFLDLAGTNAEGIIMLNSFELENDSEDYTYLKDKYEEKTGNQIDTYVTQSYDALNLVLKAIEATDGDKAAMKDWIANVKDYEGVSGKFSFNEKRVPIKEEYVFTIENGAYVQIPDLIIK